MNNLEKLFKGSGNIENYAKGYFQYLSDLLARLDTAALFPVSSRLCPAGKQGLCTVPAGLLVVAEFHVEIPQEYGSFLLSFGCDGR